MRLAEKIWLTATFSILFVFVGAARSYAQNNPTYYYVSSRGNDSNPGTESLPWRTLAKAASMATANVTVFIKQGTYRERLVPMNSGTADAPIIFTSFPGDSVIITGAGMTPPIGWWAGLIWIQGLQHIKISGLRVINSTSTGIDFEGCSYVTIEKNYIDSTYSPGIKVYGSDNVVVDGNEVVRGCTGLEEECLTLSSVNLFEVKNNLVHDGFTEGINAKNCSNGVITRNEVYNQKYRVGFYAGTWDKHQFNIDVFDNISHDNLHGFSVCSENEGLLEGIRIHNNKAYNNIDRGFWVAGLGIGQTHPAKNIAIYGNEIHNNGFGLEIGGVQGTAIDSIKIFNNIIYNNKGVGVRITRYDVRQDNTQCEMYRSSTTRSMEMAQ
jgi:parallel beta-helix repeat protein